MIRPWKAQPLLAALALALLVGCERPETQAPEQPLEEDTPALNIHSEDPATGLATLALWESRVNQAAALNESAGELYDAVLVLLDRPGIETLTRARRQWHRTHDHWLALAPVTTLARHHPRVFPELAELVQRIDAQPFEPGYLDAVAGYPYSGLVHDISLPISQRTLIEQHGLTDDGDVSLGFHALAFMLWGENRERPVVDFRARDRLSAEQAEMGLTVEEIPNNRRRDMIQLITRQLLDDLRQLTNGALAPDGTATQTFKHLGTANRVRLLASASGRLLREEAPDYFSSSSSERRGRFAGEELRQLAAVLTQLGDTWTGAEVSLLSALGEDPEPWRAELDALIAELEQEDSAALSSDTQQRWQAQLTQLAAPFN